MKTDPTKPAGDGSPAAPGNDSFLKETARAWERFWFSPMDPTTLGLIRLCCGLLTLYVTITYSWGLLAYVGPEGWLDDDVVTYLRRDMETYAPPTEWDTQY